MHKFTLVLLSTLTPFICMAQKTTEKKNIRLYEHHSSDMNQGQPFGNGADGSKSGYDFVKHTYYNSFNPSTMGKWSATELANIDMVEHNGPFGGSSFATPFGFTSATSTIWNGDIKGNDITVYAEAPATFKYDSATDVSYIKKAFPASTAKAITAVAANKVYLAKIRNTELYVAIKVTNVKNGSPNLNPGVDIASVYFDFDYKYGTYVAGTSVDNVGDAAKTFSIVPNPSKGNFEIAAIPQELQVNKATISIMDMTGRTIYSQPATSARVNQTFQAGNYIILLSDGSSTYRSRLVVVD